MAMVEKKIPASNGQMAEYIMKKKECSRREKNHMQRFSRRKGLTFEAVPTQYTRSNSYRSQFLPVILPQLGNTDVHTVAKKSQKIK